MKVEDIAAVCHEANRAYCATHGDHSHPSWPDAPPWQRQSIVNGVRFLADNPEATPANSHRSWLAEKTADGWTWGPVKDVGAKEHPCFLPYDELPPGQRIKDRLFLAVCRTLIPLLTTEGEPA